MVVCLERSADDWHNNGPADASATLASPALLLARLMGQYCFARWCLLLVVFICRHHLLSSFDGIVCRLSLHVGGQPLPGWACGQSGSRHCTAGQCGCVPLGRHVKILKRTCTYLGVEGADLVPWVGGPQMLLWGFT